MAKPFLTPQDPPTAQTLVELDVDRRPLVQQEWLWAEPQAVRFRTHAQASLDDMFPVEENRAKFLKVRPENPSKDHPESPSELATLPQQLDEAFFGVATDWMMQPLVWRVHEGVAQAVLLGDLRFTWSAEHPQGRIEHRDNHQGWAPGSFEDLELLSLWLHPPVEDFPSTEPWTMQAKGRRPVTLEMDGVLEQTARHAQRHRARKTQWSVPANLTDNVTRDEVLVGWTVRMNNGQVPHLFPGNVPDNVGGLSWCPWPMQCALGRESRRAMALELRRGLVGFAQALEALDPFWRTVRRAMYRSPLAEARTVKARGLDNHLDNDRQEQVIDLMGEPLGRLLAQWQAWRHTCAEHPRAHLLLEQALLRHVQPGLHTWRDDVWSGLTGMPSSTWRMVREGPLSTVKSLLRPASGSLKAPLIQVPRWQALSVLSVVKPGPLPVGLVHHLPGALWSGARAALDHGLGSSGSIGDAMKSWPVRRLTALLAAVDEHMWVEQRLELNDWIHQALPLIEWTLDSDSAPLKDPSWSWTTLAKHWSMTNHDSPEWSVPFRRCLYKNVHLSIVASRREWALLGSLMHNCLKDDRSKHYRNQVQQGQGVLVRLIGKGHSVAFVLWNERSDTWEVFDHRTNHNQAPPSVHHGLMQDVVMGLNATLVPHARVSDHERERRLDQAKKQGVDLSPLVRAMEESGSMGVHRPSWWRHPIKQTWAWINNDQAWNVKTFWDVFSYDLVSKRSSRWFKIAVALAIVDVGMRVGMWMDDMGPMCVIVVLALIGLAIWNVDD